MTVEVARRRFTVAEYHRMGDAGIFTDDDGIELLEGEIVTMTPIGSARGGCVNRLNRLFARVAGERAVVAVRNPLTLPPSSEPQPDGVLARPRPDLYARSHPGPQDVWLVVEVADTTVTFDRDVKIPLYARAGIPEVWLVGLPAAVVEVHRGPSPGGYGDVARLGRGQRLACQAFPDLAIRVDDVLG